MSRRQKPGLHIADKSRQYFRMLCDSSHFYEAGVPAGIPAPSLKTHCFSKGAFVTGTAGVGFVYVGPWQGATNDTSFGFYSGPAFAGSAFSSTTAANAVISMNTNSQFTAAEIGVAPLAQYRLISAELKIRYTGTELNLGGTVHALHHPEQESLTGVTVQGIDLYKQTSRFAVSRRWSSIHYCPSNNAITYFEDPNPTTVHGFMGFLVQSPAGNSFDFEFYGNYEYVGRNVRGQTPSHNDSVAYNAAQATMSMPPFGVTDAPPEKYVPKMENLFEEVLKEGSTYVLGAAAKAATTAAVAALI